LDNPKAYGKQEIVIDTPLANVATGDLNQSQLTNLLLTYRQRTSELKKIANIKYVLVFKNHGIEAGASLAHAHSQIFALPMIPENLIAEDQIITQYYQQNQIDLVDEIINFEKTEHQRLISENQDFIAFCPYASRWPLEVWIVAKRKVSDFAQFSDSELVSLSQLLQPIIHKLTDYHVSYNYYLQNGASHNHRFMLKIASRNLSTWGGFEVATGMIIDTVPPEAAARWYKT